MSEKSTVAVANAIRDGNEIVSITSIPQTAYRTKNLPADKSLLMLASSEECVKNKEAFAKNFVITEEESNKLQQRPLAEKSGDEWVVINPSFPPMTQEEMDDVYALPFSRLPHPRYDGKEPIPAFEMIKDSVTIHRGCFGGCSFCTISAHQGKFIASRSKESILNELKTIVAAPTFKGHIGSRRAIGKYVSDERCE